MNAFAYERAASVDQAVERREEGDRAEFLAGGTTLIDLVKLGVMRPARLIDVNHLALSEIAWRPDGGVEIGALVRNSDLAHDHAIREKYPVLAEALLSGASPQLRNMATTAGNLLQRTRCPYFRDNFSACNKRVPGTGCAAQEGFNRSHAILGTSEACIATHPSDLCVALAALEAEIAVQGKNGRRKIAFEDFHLLPGETPQKEFALAPGELITGVSLPAPARDTRSWYVKLRDRESFEFALASAAVVLSLQADQIASAKIALGGVATKPWRARAAEARLAGSRPSPELFQEAAGLAIQRAKPHRHNAFKVELARRVLVRALTLTAAGQPPVRSL